MRFWNRERKALEMAYEDGEITNEEYFEKIQELAERAQEALEVRADELHDRARDERMENEH